MPDMTPTSLVAALVPRTEKIVKNGLHVFEFRKQQYNNSSNQEF